MPFLTFLLQAVFISLSGVMAPGPMTAVTVGKGNRSPHAGVFVAFGHGMFEVPLMIFIFFGFGFLLKFAYVKTAIAFLGGIVLLLIGISMFRSANSDKTEDKKESSPITSGFLLTAGNPFFLVWWATVGSILIFRAMEFGIFGLLTFALVHWLCDLFWLYFLSVLSFKGGQFFGKKFQKIVFIICGVFLVFLSGKFIYDAVKLFINTLPESGV